MSDTLKAVLAEAQRADDLLKRECYEAERAAVEQVKAAYRDRLAAAASALSAAKQAVRDAIDSTSSHPWDGRRVFTVRDEAVSRWSRTMRPVRYEGIVEVVRQTSKFPENMTWRRPSLGAVIIRKPKKDGTAGLSFYDYGLADIACWQLVEAAQGMSARESRDPQGLGPKAASPVAEGDAPDNSLPSHNQERI